MLFRLAPHKRYVPGTGLQWPPWQVTVGGALCLIAAGWLLWLRPTPYSGPESQDPDSLTTLDLGPNTEPSEKPVEAG